MLSQLASQYFLATAALENIHPKRNPMNDGDLLMGQGF